MRLRAVVLTLLLLAVLAGPLAEGYQSGRHNSTGGCSCHSGGSGQVTPIFSGLPSSYVPGQSYSVGISGTGGPSGSEGGFSLTVNKGSWSNPGASVQIDVLSVTHSNDARRSWTVTWTAPSAGQGTATFNVAVNNVNGNGQNSGDGWGVRSLQVTEQAQANNEPSASNLQLSPYDPTAATGLALSYTYSDPDGDAESGTTIRWSRDGSLVSGFDDQMSIAVVKGEEWLVDVTPSDGEDDGTTMSAGPVTIGNAAPSVDNALITPASPDEMDVLSTSYDYSDVDLDLESGSTITWYLDGSRVTELDDSTSVSHLMTRQGDQWQFSVLPSDGSDAGTEVFSDIVIIDFSNNAPTCSALSLTPLNPSTEDALSTGWQYNDVDGDSSSDEEIEWFLDAAYVPALDGVLVLPANQTAKGDSWNFRMRVSDGMMWSDWSVSSSVTIQNSPPQATGIFDIEPIQATSSDDLVLSLIYSDVDGDSESGSVLNWYRNGQLQVLYSGLATVPASATNRGETWMARYSPRDGTVYGDQVQSTSVTIANSRAVVTNLSLSSDGTALQPIILAMQSADADWDQIEVSIRWIRDGFQVGELDNVTLVDTEWLDVGQYWSVEIDLHDGFAGSPTVLSNIVWISNLLPTADFVTSEVVLIEATTVFDGSLSSDLDSGIAAWFWDVAGTIHSGQRVEIILTEPTTIVNLTVIDFDGGQHSIERTLTAVWGETPKNLDAYVASGEVRLDWDWTGEATNFTIWRTHEPVTHSSRLGVLEPLATTSATDWSEPMHLAGTYHYTVTADIGDVHNPRISSNSASVDLEISQMEAVEPAADMEAGTGALSVLLFLTIFVTLATALMDRFLGRRS